VWVSTTLTSPSLLLGCIYNPPSSSQSSLDHVSSLFAAADSAPYDNKIIVGDFNLPNFSWNLTGSHTQKYAYLASQLLVSGWVQLVDRPTRERHILDLVFTNGTLSAKAFVGPTFPDSDHKVVLCQFQKPRSVPSPRMLSFHTFTPAILSSFAQIMRALDWSNYFLASEVQAAADLFYGSTLSLLSTICPLVQSKLHTPSNDRLLIKKARKIKRLRYLYQTTRDISVLLNLQRHIAGYSTLNSSYELSQERKALSLPINHKGLATLFRKRCARSSESPCFIKTAEGDTITNAAEVAEHFNTYFSTCYTNPSPALLTTNSPRLLRSSSCLHTLSSVCVTLSDVEAKLRTLKDSGIHGPDGLFHCF